MEKITKELNRLTIKSKENEKYLENYDFIQKIILEDIKFMARILLNQNYNFSFYQIECSDQFKLLDYLNNQGILQIINHLKYKYNGYQQLYDELIKYNIPLTLEFQHQIKKIVDQYILFLESKLETIEHY